MAPISCFSPQNVLCCPGKNPSPSQQQGGGVWGRTELLPQALHLRLQALAVGCRLPLQLLVLPAHFWEPGRGERDDRRNGRELPELGTRPWWPGGRLSSCGGNRSASAPSVGERKRARSFACGEDRKPLAEVFTSAHSSSGSSAGGSGTAGGFCSQGRLPPCSACTGAAWS